jgi:hypothetical protein
LPPERQPPQWRQADAPVRDARCASEPESFASVSVFIAQRSHRAKIAAKTDYVMQFRQIASGNRQRYNALSTTLLPSKGEYRQTPRPKGTSGGARPYSIKVIAQGYSHALLSNWFLDRSK